MRLLYIAVIVIVLIQAFVFYQWYIHTRPQIEPEDRELVAELKGADGPEVHDRIVAMLAGGEQARAEEILDAVLPRHRGDLRLTFLQGVLRRSRFSESAAASWFGKTIEIDSSSPEARCGRLVIALDSGSNVDRDFQALIALVNEFPDDPLMRWSLAIQCRALRRNHEGAKQYRILEEIWDPGPCLLHQSFANILDDLGLYDESLKHRHMAAEQEAAPFSYHALGATLRKMGRPEEALPYLEEAAQMDPYYSKTWATWGLALSDLGRDEEAVEKQLRGAQYGQVYCTFNLGRIYEKGRGVEQDYAKAMQCYREAAQAGHGSAINNVGALYELGLGVDRDYAAAMHWYKKAADHGHERAMSNIGDLYAEGKGVSRDREKAMEWQRRAAANGSGSGMAQLGLYYEKGWGTKRNVREAIGWYEKGIANGSKVAMFNLALIYAHGKGVPKDGAKAARLFRMMIEKDYMVHEATGRLASLYLHGDGVPKDHVEALKLYRAAAESKKDFDVRRLAWMLCCGDTEVRDIGEGVRLYRALADKGGARSQNSLAWIMATSRDTSFHDGSEAVKYALMATRQKEKSTYLDTLAAAYARDGQFEKAVETQQKAISAIKKEKSPNKEEIADFETRLRLYEEGKPYTSDG